MLPDPSLFQRSVLEQIAINQARTPTERFLALCDLLDTVHAMAPNDPESQERRRRAMAARQRQREEAHVRIRQLFAAERAKAKTGV